MSMENILLIDLLTQAGKLALKEQEQMEVKTKPDTSIVTNGDLAVSQFLEQGLKLLYPDFEIFSEENAGNVPQGDKIIVIDPIDGTQSYSRKQDSWGILVGFLESGVITQGYVYQPTKDLLYFAQKGKGAFKVENKTLTSLNAQRSGSTISYSSPSRGDENEFIKHIGIDDARFMYSASLKIMEIAKGDCDLYPNFQKKCSIWDLIAPEIILTESGGKIIYETPLVYDFTKPNVDIRFCAVGPRFFDLKF